MAPVGTDINPKLITGGSFVQRAREQLRRAVRWGRQDMRKDRAVLFGAITSAAVTIMLAGWGYTQTLNAEFKDLDRERSKDRAIIAALQAEIIGMRESLRTERDDRQRFESAVVLRLDSAKEQLSALSTDIARFRDDLHRGR